MRADLRARLRERIPEIERALLERVYAVADPTDADPAYVEGLRSSVSIALEYALEAIELGEERAPLPPPALLAQARIAARNRVGLDIVLRRYVAGYTLLGEFLAEEVARGRFPGSRVNVLPGKAVVLDRLLHSVTIEYQREMDRQSRSSRRRRTERVRQLLAGEPIDTSVLGYNFDDWHLGLVASGVGAGGFLRDVAKRLGHGILLVQPDDETAWGWLAARNPPDSASVAHSPMQPPEHLKLAIGEPGERLAGWRLTHRQAAAALPIANRRPEPIIRYADVALVATVLKDELLATALRQLYLRPLEEERDGGDILRETLRAYFALGGHVSSSAAALKTSRQTVAKRLSRVEERLGRPLDACAAELRAALEYADLEPPG